MGKIMVVAGEVSGDMHAARVVQEIEKMAPETEFSGMGSTRLQSEGVNVIIDPTEISTIGFVEALKNLKTHLSHMRLLSQHIDEYQPDGIFLVDYSGFNMRMAQIAHKKNIPVVNYFAPSAWVWGEWRARWMARNNATIAAVFPMEKEVYLEAGARVNFVGHPLLDIVEVELDKSSICRKLELDPEQKIIGLLPGSRTGEIKKLLPVMLKAAEKLYRDKREVQFVLPLAPGVSKSRISRISSQFNLVLKIIEGDTYQVMKIADLLITASGTATLEAAIMETPMIIIYKSSWSTYQLWKLLASNQFIGLPNIIARSEIVPELTQEEATVDNVYQETLGLISKPYLLKNMKMDLIKVKERLGGRGAITRTAELVLKCSKIKGF